MVNTYMIKINVRGNDDGSDEVCNGGRYKVTSSQDEAQFIEDWRKCKDELTESGEMWDSPDEIVNKMMALGYEFDNCDIDEIEVEA